MKGKSYFYVTRKKKNEFYPLLFFIYPSEGLPKFVLHHLYTLSGK